MPRVVISGQAARRFTGGQTEFEVEANNFRRMVPEFDRRYPDLGRRIEESMAVAIDGEIFQDAYLAPLKPESEIYLIPKIGGGYFLSLSLRGAAGAAAISFSEIASPGTAHQGWPSGDRNDIAAHSSGNPAAPPPTGNAMNCLPPAI